MGFGQRTGEEILGKREAAQYLKLALAKPCRIDLSVDSTRLKSETAG